MKDQKKGFYEEDTYTFSDKNVVLHSCTAYQSNNSHLHEPATKASRKTKLPDYSTLKNIKAMYTAI